LFFFTYILSLPWKKHIRLDCKGDAREVIGDRKVIDRIHTVNRIPIDNLLESPLDDDG
jgi:hypothetical protein